MEFQDEKRGEIVNHLDFDRHLVRQRNEELLREVRALPLEGQLRKVKGNSMVKVSVEVRSGAARFRVGIQASSIRRAVSLAEGLYSASDEKVIFPIDPEGFFVEEAFAEEVLMEGGKPQKQEEELVA